jgi:hypothetical protein
MFTPLKLTRSFGLMLASFAIVGQMTIAQCAPAVSVPVIAADAPPVTALRTSEVEGDPALQVKVSFTAKSQPLDELLNALQTQSKVVLVAAPDSPAKEVKVTAYIQDLPLSQVLLGLSRLYGVRWAKSGANGFTMLASDKGKLELGLMQLGDLDGFRARFLEAQRKSPEHKDWPQEIVKYISEQDLINGASPLISSLPPELLSQIRREKEQMAALRLVEMYQAAMEASVDDYILRAEVPEPTTDKEGNPLPTSPRIVVRKANGQGVASLTPSQPVAPPKGNDANKNQPTKNIPGPT